MAKRRTSINLRTDPVIKLARAWLKKFDQPTNPTGRFVRGLRTYEPGCELPARPFDPEAVLAQYRATGTERMKRLTAATKLLK